jgi:hypothetical protein
MPRSVQVEVQDSANIRHIRAPHESTELSELLQAGTAA